MNAATRPAALRDLRSPSTRRSALGAVWGISPLSDRLGLGSRRRGSGQPPSTAAAARIAFYLLSLGATATLASLAFGVRDEVGVAACAVAAYGLALVCLAGYDRLPERGFQAVSLAASVIVTLGLFFGGPDSTYYQQFYVWIVLYAAYHFPPLAAAFQAVVIGVAYGIVLGFTDVAASAPVAWFLTMATLLVAGVITIVLHSRVEARLGDLRAQNERLREADELKDEFLATVSHELRTPLTAIRGYLELALEDDEQRLSDEQRRFLQVIDRNSLRLERQVNDLLIVTQIEARTLAVAHRPVDVARVVADALGRHRDDAAERGLTLSAELQPVAGTVSGDAGRLGELLDALLDNALKFTPAGGSVVVRLQPLRGGVALEVADDGPGIPADAQPRLFERFYRARGVTAAAVPGTGIGLTIALGIAEGHDGTIECTSTEGAGSTFRVVLPTTDEAPA